MVASLPNGRMTPSQTFALLASLNSQLSGERYGVVCCGVVWCGVVWCGVVCCVVKWSGDSDWSLLASLPQMWYSGMWQMQ